MPVPPKWNSPNLSCSAKLAQTWQESAIKLMWSDCKQHSCCFFKSNIKWMQSTSTVAAIGANLMLFTSIPCVWISHIPFTNLTVTASAVAASTFVNFLAPLNAFTRKKKSLILKLFFFKVARLTSSRKQRAGNESSEPCASLNSLTADKSDGWAHKGAGWH